jgi:hypothetical protein
MTEIKQNIRYIPVARNTVAEFLFRLIELHYTLYERKWFQLRGAEADIILYTDQPARRVSAALGLVDRRHWSASAFRHLRSLRPRSASAA